MSEVNSTVNYRLVPGFPAYRVGDDGSVWSRWFPGPGRRYGSWKRRKAQPVCKEGHLAVGLKAMDSTARQVLVHRLVLEVFVGPCPPGMECRHFPDHDPTNNRLSNLSWGTKAENMADKLVHGTDNRGERNCRAVLTASKVRQIREQRRLGKQYKELGRRFGVSIGLISMIVNRQIWKHVD